MKTVKVGAAVAAAILLAGMAQASPMTLAAGGLSVLDNDTHLEWIRNMGLGGRGNWAAANDWIATLNASNYAGHNDWRLPALNPSDTTCSGNFDPGGGFPIQYYGDNCTGSELSRLFVTNLGTKAGESVQDQTGDTAEQVANLALFSQVDPFTYWSGVEYAPDTNNAWAFFAGVSVFGHQGAPNKNLDGGYALAVRATNLAFVPEPQTLTLTLLALGATVVVRRRRPS